MIQIRNVPDPLHRRMKARAAMAGMSLSDYLLKEIGELAERAHLGADLIGEALHGAILGAADQKENAVARNAQLPQDFAPHEPGAARDQYVHRFTVCDLRFTIAWRLLPRRKEPHAAMLQTAYQPPPVDHQPKSLKPPLLMRTQNP